MKRIILILLMFLGLSLTANAEEGYNVTNLKADLQTLAPGDFGWADTIWTRICNMGIQEVGQLADCSVDTITVKFVAGQSYYAMPVKFRKIWAVLNRTSYKTTEKLAITSWGQGGTGLEAEIQKVDGVVSSKAKVGKFIGFYPKPLTVDSVLVIYFKVPDKVTAAADTIDVLACYHTAVINACMKYVWRRAKRWDLANLSSVELINDLNNAKAAMSSLPPDIIVTPRILKKGGQ